MLGEQGDEDEKSHFEEMMLIDDCCDEILRRLPLNDLCALSCTCTLLQKEYPSKVLHIKYALGCDTLIKDPSEERYISCFDKSILMLS